MRLPRQLKFSVKYLRDLDKNDTCNFRSSVAQPGYFELIRVDAPLISVGFMLDGGMEAIALVCVDPRRAREALPHAAALLKAACRRTELSAFQDIETDVLSGRSLLWLAWNGQAIRAVATTALINSEIGKVCVITACGGTGMKRWLPLLDGIEAYAKDEGCVRVRIYGRKGWLRVLDGYREKHVIMDKVLTCTRRSAD